MPMTPYSPWPVTEKPVSHDRMREILAKRAKGPAPTVAETQEIKAIEPEMLAKPADSRPPLDWNKATRHAEGVASVFDSTRHYRIDILSKQKGEASYTCWAVAQDSGHLNERLGCVDKADEARRFCDAHRSRQ